MAARSVNLEMLLNRLRRGGGLLLVGAGASAGVTPFGEGFMTAPALDYTFRAGSYPVAIPQQPALNRRIIGMTVPRLANGVTFDGQIHRAGPDAPLIELVHRLPDYYTRLSLKHALAKPRFEKSLSDNYAVFDRFDPSVIANYNLDGLARRARAAGHCVIDMHRTIPAGYGAPEIADLLKMLRENDLPSPLDDILLCVPEVYEDLALAKRLAVLEALRPSFVAVIGYSFGRNGDGFDDHVSMTRLGRAFRDYRGEVYVIDPAPAHLRETIAACIRSDAVYGVPAYWNVLAHAFLDVLAGRTSKSINYVCQETLDNFGSLVRFPRRD